MIVNSGQDNRRRDKRDKNLQTPAPMGLYSCRVKLSRQYHATRHATKALYSVPFSCRVAFNPAHCAPMPYSPIDTTN